jgi:C-terminal processing protease CtpA/Prc
LTQSTGSRERRAPLLTFFALAAAIPPNRRLVIKRLIRNAIARRRAKKAREERKKALLAEGKKDDTEDKVFDVVLDLKQGGLGLVVRAAGKENAKKAKELGLVESEEDALLLPEVNTVKEGGNAEKSTIAPGDLFLEVNGKRTKLKKLKKAIEKAKGPLEGGLLKLKVMRGESIKAGTSTVVDKKELPPEFRSAKSAVVKVEGEGGGGGTEANHRTKYAFIKR